MSRTTVTARIVRRPTVWTHAAAGAALAILLAGCQTNRVVEPGFPQAYAERHPIAITEGDAAHEILIGSGRARLTPVQRAELTAFAGTWRRRATGGVIIQVPSGTINEAAARAAVAEVRSVMTAAGIPSAGIAVQTYRSEAYNSLAPLRVVYPTIKADAGPCGLWPDDLGVQDGFHEMQNRPYWNFGCASQKALAAMVDNPADLIQPRSEQPASAARRRTVMEKYVQGKPTKTEVSSDEDNKISTVGK